MVFVEILNAVPGVQEDAFTTLNEAAPVQVAVWATKIFVPGKSKMAITRQNNFEQLIFNRLENNGMLFFPDDNCCVCMVFMDILCNGYVCIGP